MSKIKILKSASGYDLAAPGYDKKEKYLNSFEQNKFLLLLGDLQNKKVLDVGAGTGRLSLLLAKAGAEVTALDLSVEMLKILKNKNKKIATVIGDAGNLPFENNSFDIVAAAFLIVHLKDPITFFDETYRVLKDGGILAVSNINQKEAPEVETKQGKIKIESYYHRQNKIVEDLESLAFQIEKNVLLYEKDIWINQIIIAKK
ncbi:MAG: class I SAM-dependent methyltransferase [Candidatus Magasanikbacteria bacterium]|nr:class I SAM-dependent methyltransferase [Candidatus Magasanikbacteria bacterium]